MASLISTEGTSFELAEGDNLIGRGGREFNDPPKVDVGPLTGGTTVSRHHARVQRQGGQWYLKVELESRNPTLVGGREIPKGDEVVLSDDTPVQLGDVILTFHAPVSHTEASNLDRTIMPDLPPQPEPAQPPPLRAAPPRPQQAPPTPLAKAERPTSDSWVARLPDRPEMIGTIGVREFKRVNPFRGLMIDDAAWKDAHDYHRILAQLHLLAGHGWGIVDGLEVVADENGPNTIVVHPGVAFDFMGRAILVAQERRLPIGASSGSTLYVVARLREEMAAPQRFWNDLDEYTRVIEKCEIQLATTLPSSPSLELARVTIDGSIRNAPNPLDPKVGEIDLRFRERILVRPRPDLVVAQLAADGADGGPESARNHQIGLRFLLREIGLTTSYRPRWGGIIPVGAPIPPASLLYLSGSRTSASGGALAGQLRPFLAGGGVLLADCCTQNDAKEFSSTIDGLASALDRSMQPVERWHPLLTSRHVFATPPLAAMTGPALLEADGLVLTTADYGCAWSGGSADKPLPRETIRSALEFGVNLAVYARQRQRPLDALELE